MSFVQSLIQESLRYWTEGGFLLAVIAAICFAIWCLLFRLNARYRSALSVPDAIEDDLMHAAAQNSEHSFSDLAQGSANPYTDIFRHLAQRRRQGMSLLDAFKEARETELAPFERNLGLLKALVSAAPLLGLLGTVLGMIGTFDGISMQVRDTTGLMSSGISQALITTQFGLIVALPGLAGISALTHKHKQLGVRLAILQQHLILGLQAQRPVTRDWNRKDAVAPKWIAEEVAA